jgi:actin-related protein 10
VYIDLEANFQLPVDLRHSMISNILAVGGTASLPNFIPCLRDSIVEALQPMSMAQNTLSLAQWKRRNSEPYRELYELLNKLAILNDPKPIDGRGGTAPRWTPGLMSWVGGSLAG